MWGHTCVLTWSTHEICLNSLSHLTWVRHPLGYSQEPLLGRCFVWPHIQVVYSLPSLLWKTLWYSILGIVLFLLTVISVFNCMISSRKLPRNSELHLTPHCILRLALIFDPVSNIWRNVLKFVKFNCEGMTLWWGFNFMGKISAMLKL